MEFRAEDRHDWSREAIKPTPFCLTDLAIGE